MQGATILLCLAAFFPVDRCGAIGIRAARSARSRQGVSCWPAPNGTMPSDSHKTPRHSMAILLVVAPWGSRCFLGCGTRRAFYPFTLDMARVYKSTYPRTQVLPTGRECLVAP